MIKQTFTLRALLCAALLFLPFSLKADFDEHFETSMRRWMPGHDWRLLKAQCMTESALRTDAVSPVGAAGICQFMPPTWLDAEKSRVVPPGTNPFNAKWNIEAGAWYNRRMFNIWKSKRPVWDRYQLAWASYNAGAGHIIKAQKLCNMAVLYEGIVACLPAITGHHSRETLNYVPKIEKTYRGYHATTYHF